MKRPDPSVRSFWQIGLLGRIASPDDAGFINRTILLSEFAEYS